MESFLLVVILEKDLQIFLCFNFRLYHRGDIKATPLLADLFLCVCSSQSISAPASCRLHFLSNLFLHTYFFFHLKFLFHVSGVKPQTRQVGSFLNERFQTAKTWTFYYYLFFSFSLSLACKVCKEVWRANI